MFRENKNELKRFKGTVNIKHVLFNVKTKEFAEEEMCTCLLLGQDI